MSTIEQLSENDWALTACGLWECGHCHQIVSETHFYRDRATGEMRHCADPVERGRLADRCGWSFDYDYGGVQRCAEPYWHKAGEHNPRIHGYGGFSERTTKFGLRPPAREPSGTDTRGSDGD